MIVGILSDTHGYLPAKAIAALSTCDHIIHAGDIGSKRILRFLGNYAPVTAVLGNNDHPVYGPEVGRYARVELDGVRFLVAHYPQDVTGRGLADAVGSDGVLPEVCVHGHTHVPRLFQGWDGNPQGLLVCPGSCSLPRGGSSPSVAKVTVEDGVVLFAEIVEL